MIKEKRFLLSDGRTTTSSVVYVQDLIRVNLSLRKRDIPYWFGGSDDIIKTYDKDQVTDSIGDILTDMLDYISRTTGCNLKLSNLKISSNIIHIEVALDNLVIPYDIKR